MKKYTKILVLLFFISTQVYAANELIINSEPAYNPTYHNRFSFLLGINPSIKKKTNDITNLTFSYGKKLEDFWIDTNILLTNGLFSKISTNNPTATGLSNDQLIDTKSTITTFGVGIGRESRYAQTFLPFEGLYELMAADLTYNVFNESTSEKTFTGPGMIAKFALYKKYSESFSMGAQFIYNLAVVKRAATNETDNSSSTSLTMSYLTVGFDLSFYL